MKEREGEGWWKMKLKEREESNGREVGDGDRERAVELGVRGTWLLADASPTRQAMRSTAHRLMARGKG
jgi:hypothetical protein